jgi:hypothetical protein
MNNMADNCSSNNILSGYEIRMLLMEIINRRDIKNKFSGYNDVFCSGYRMALEDVLKVKRPRIHRSG